MGKLLAKVSTAAVLALAALPALGLAQAAQAAHAAPIQPVVRIPVGDLDLSRADHAVVLKTRIDTAGEAMCQQRTRQERLDRWSGRACRLDFYKDVEAQLTRPQARALRSVGG